MQRTLLALGMLAILWLPAGAENDEARSEGKMLDGTWLPQAAELGGQPFPEAILRQMSLAMTDGRYTVKVGGQVDTGTFVLGPEAQPRAIDITGTEGPNRGKTIPAIFALQADTLRVCYDLAGKVRPTVFATAKDTQQFLVRYARAKE